MRKHSSQRNHKDLESAVLLHTSTKGEMFVNKTMIYWESVCDDIVANLSWWPELPHKNEGTKINTQVHKVHQPRKSKQTIV